VGERVTGASLSVRQSWPSKRETHALISSFFVEGFVVVVALPGMGCVSECTRQKLPAALRPRRRVRLGTTLADGATKQVHDAVVAVAVTGAGYAAAFACAAGRTDLDADERAAVAAHPLGAGSADELAGRVHRIQSDQGIVL